MSTYTTGELASLCHVTVRTVQYYDRRGLLVPSATSESGRRIYSEGDLSRLRIICFLRDLGLPIDSIKELLSEEKPEEVISLLLEQQTSLLQKEMQERRERLAKLEALRRTLPLLQEVSVESIGDIAKIMENKAKLRKLHGNLILGGLVMDVIEVGTFVYGILRGIWWPFAIGMAAALGLGVILCRHYYRRARYLCPHCHRVFQPAFREFLLSAHTPHTRRLHCGLCGHHGFCIETCEEDEPC